MSVIVTIKGGTQKPRTTTQKPKKTTTAKKEK